MPGQDSCRNEGRRKQSGIGCKIGHAVHAVFDALRYRAAPSPAATPVAKRRLQQIAAGRRFPVEHLARDEHAGPLLQHEALVDRVEWHAAGGRDRARDRRGAGQCAPARLSAMPPVASGASAPSLPLRRLLRQSDRSRRQRHSLAQHVRERLLAARRAEPAHRRLVVHVGHADRRSVSASPVCIDRLAQQRRQRIDRAAFQSAARDHGFAAHALAAKRQRDRASAAGLRSGRGRWSDHATTKPQFAGLQRRDRRCPSRARISDPAAIGAEPRPACAAERQHRRIRRRHATAPSGVSNSSAPSSSQPVQRCRSANCTPIASSRRSQARSSGDAFIAFGNTRPLEPTKVGWPSSALQSRSASGGNASIAASQMRLRRAIARQESVSASLCVRLSPPRPAIRNLRPSRRHPLIDGDRDACAAPATSAAISPAGPPPTIAAVPSCM